MWEICKSPWCKGRFEYEEYEMVTDENGNKIPPKYCQKCKSFETELSGGVEWKNKEYEGNRWDGTPHQISYKVKKYY